MKDSLFEESALDVGDEFMAVKPWLGAIKEPTGYKKQSNANLKPACSLNLEYVHGYRSKDCRNNLRYVDDNTIVYHAAAVCVVHDISENNK